jgi:2-C-methyl-D-erythritol 4-phosphate cytidylyltransferase
MTRDEHEHGLDHHDGHDVPRAPGHLSRDATPAELRGAENTVRDVGVIIVAAGSGTRVGGTELKQFRWIAGKPMLLHSIQNFQRRADVAMVVVALPKSHAGDPPPWIFQSDLERLLVTAGGRERSDSVFNALDDMPDEVKVILVHDAARPFVTPATIDRVIAAARQGTGAVAGLPVVDTLKEVDEHGTIVRTVDRTRLWRAQTPQGFPRLMLERAHVEARNAGVTATDDAALCERLGLPVVMVRGAEQGLKITEEADFTRAELLGPLPDA